VIRLDGPWILDEHGRTLMLRGVNLGGSSKVPARPDGATYRSQSFFNHRQVSFVGRPFPLEQADEHFARLRRWGLTFLRFLVTWEAIEHQGPGLYDLEYLDYLEAVVRKAGEHGLTLFIDPHQDVWSRFSGGDGAPGWTLEAAGFDLANLCRTGAAVVHQIVGDPFPRMIWPTNSVKLAAATMFTLFFGGDDFAPRTRLDGEPAQGYLQRHYIESVRQVALRLRGHSCVVGYDTMNEPEPGYIGWKDLDQPPPLLRIGPTPSPFQSMALGEGLPADVSEWKLTPLGVRRGGVSRLDPQGARAWVEGRACPWREHGVWEIGPGGSPVLLKPDYFASRSGVAVNFGQDYYRPFARRFAEAIRSVDPGSILFVEGAPFGGTPRWQPGDPDRIIYAPHWYDDYVLVLKSYSPFLAFDARHARVVIGPGAVRRSFREQLASFAREAVTNLGGAPTLIGEVGIPFDLRGKRAYADGDYRLHVRALNRIFRAIEDNLLGCTLWNYTADNTNARGDQWNDEDLSLFSRDQQADPGDPDSGGRALEAAVRPYPRAVAGEPRRMRFDPATGSFDLEFHDRPGISAPTEVFVPERQYPGGPFVTVSDGTWEHRPVEQMLLYRHERANADHHVRLRRR
jgi:hypothetical protein